MSKYFSFSVLSLSFAMLVLVFERFIILFVKYIMCLTAPVSIYESSPWYCDCFVIFCLYAKSFFSFKINIITLCSNFDILIQVLLDMTKPVKMRVIFDRNVQKNKSTGWERRIRLNTVRESDGG